jgi:sugar phosphate isomerase/epimerase
MKISGHTLGTPNMSVPEALQLFHNAGIQAAEIIWADDYPAGIPEENNMAVVNEIKQSADDLGMEIAGLTPYMSDFNHLDPGPRQRDFRRMLACIETAATIRAPHIRVYAGNFKPGDRNRLEKWNWLVDSLHRLGEYAQQAGVLLCVENHFNTMTVSAAETVALVQAVNSPAVRILYDQANLTFTHNEPYEQAIPLQQKWISHVHVKDLVFIDPNKPFSADAVARVKAEDRSVRSRVVGEGILDWAAILSRLKEIGYQSYLSLEYEYRWHPQDLPEPEEGFRRSAETLSKILASL